MRMLLQQLEMMMRSLSSHCVGSCKDVIHPSLSAPHFTTYYLCPSPSTHLTSYLTTYLSTHLLDQLVRDMEATSSRGFKAMIETNLISTNLFIIYQPTYIHTYIHTYLGQFVSDVEAISSRGFKAMTETNLNSTTLPPINLPTYLPTSLPTYIRT